MLGGKANRGKSVLDTTSDLLGRPLTDEEYFKSAILGWCTELLQAALLVADDIMDSSETRRGSKCWYMMPNVGMNALNDAFMLVSSIFILLQKYFSGDKNYIAILELFHEVMFKTEVCRPCILVIFNKLTGSLDRSAGRLAYSTRRKAQFRPIQL